MKTWTVGDTGFYRLESGVYLPCTVVKVNQKTLRIVFKKTPLISDDLTNVRVPIERVSA